MSRSARRDVPATNEMDHLSFREELHALEAVLAGQGIGLLSDLLVGDELKAGTLVKALDVKMSVLRFYLVHPAGHPRRREIDALSRWLQSVR
jgi:LysR family glycine cleavage system transcriptional activator